MSDYTFNVTDSAVAAIKSGLEKSKMKDGALRVGIRGGLCEGYGYVLEFTDKEPREKDLVFTFDGMQVIIDKKSILYLNGAELNYKKTMFESGFEFNNPIAVSSCGCKESFSID
jgi:iron-sulfur cluster assembly protein